MAGEVFPPQAEDLAEAEAELRGQTQERPVVELGNAPAGPPLGGGE
ncbi:MAG: hypothetical protein ABR569_04150 [Gaiellaceae bacterium]